MSGRARDLSTSGMPLPPLVEPPGWTVAAFVGIVVAVAIALVVAIGVTASRERRASVMKNRAKQASTMMVAPSSTPMPRFMLDRTTSSTGW